MRGVTDRRPRPARTRRRSAARTARCPGTAPARPGVESRIIRSRPTMISRRTSTWRAGPWQEWTRTLSSSAGTTGAGGPAGRSLGQPTLQPCSNVRRPTGRTDPAGWWVSVAIRPASTVCSSRTSRPSEASNGCPAIPVLGSVAATDRPGPGRRARHRPEFHSPGDGCGNHRCTLPVLGQGRDSSRACTAGRPSARTCSPGPAGRPNRGRRQSGDHRGQRCDRIGRVDALPQPPPQLRLPGQVGGRPGHPSRRCPDPAASRRACPAGGRRTREQTGHPAGDRVSATLPMPCHPGRGQVTEVPGQRPAPGLARGVVDDRRAAATPPRPVPMGRRARPPASSAISAAGLGNRTAAQMPSPCAAALPPAGGTAVGSANVRPRGSARRHVDRERIGRRNRQQVSQRARPGCPHVRRGVRAGSSAAPGGGTPPGPTPAGPTPVSMIRSASLAHAAAACPAHRPGRRACPAARSQSGGRVRQCRRPVRSGGPVGSVGREVRHPQVWHDLVELANLDDVVLQQAASVGSGNAPCPSRPRSS